MALRTRGSRSETIQKDPPAARGDERKVKIEPTRKWWKNKLFYLLLIPVMFYLTVPVVVRFCPWVQQALIFVHHVKTPFYGNISNPVEFGLRNAREFELFHTDDGCEIEVWQILPKSYGGSENHDYIAALSDGVPIVLYLHGNTGTRATYHRVQLYKYLAEDRGYHVVTFDYRGFANSLCFPSERSMMEDGFLVWRWIKEHAPSSRVFIWGHSLGSAAAAYLTQELCLSQDIPSGLILDAPFPNIIEAASHHPMSLPFWPVISLFRYFVLESFEERFESERHVEHITCPLLILHGQSDILVPFHLGEQLYKKALETRQTASSKSEVSFVNCRNTTHKDNYASPDTHTALDSFIQVP